MINFPYVVEYNLFERVDIKVAEELLGEYNDFYLYNQSQYYDIFKKAKTEATEGGEEPNLAQMELNAKSATDQFAKLFGSKDFAKSTMLGLKINWYDLQQILLLEFKNKTPIGESAVIHTAYQLRNLATILLYAEYMVDAMGKIKLPNEEITEAVKAKFTTALEILAEKTMSLPEFHSNKKPLAKLKTPEQFMEFANTLLS